MVVVGAWVLSSGTLPAADKTDKADKQGAAKGAAERLDDAATKRIALARKRAQDAAKRVFSRFDANKDKQLDAEELARAKAALDKLIEADAARLAGKKLTVKELAGDDLTPGDSASGVTLEAFQEYAGALVGRADEAGRAAKEDRERPAKPPGDAGRESTGEREVDRRREEAERRREEARERAEERRERRERQAADQRRAAEEQAARQRQAAEQAARARQAQIERERAAREKAGEQRPRPPRPGDRPRPPR
jgi:hypothetical protein